MTKEKAIRTAANNIWTGAITRRAAEVIDEIIDRGDAHVLLSDLIQLAKTECESEDVAFEEVLRRLEGLAEQSRLAACVLMMHFLPIVSETYLHGVCDSIGLWIWHCESPKLTEHLRLMAQSQTDPKYRRIFEDLVNRGSSGE
ncbi:MAG: hypothetical protein GC200_11805 [Tepidisphaera sp.]|nr:hypothetical protein [Tepidisphaera sp.]